MISPNPASPNGTRARILILLTKNGPMTTAEIAYHLGLTPKQVRDNSNQARHEDLIASGLAPSLPPARGSTTADADAIAAAEAKRQRRAEKRRRQTGSGS